MKKYIFAALFGMISSNMMTAQVNNQHPVPGTDGNKYVAYEERTGNESVVYFTRNLSAEGFHHIRCNFITKRSKWSNNYNN